MFMGTANRRNCFALVTALVAAVAVPAAAVFVYPPGSWPNGKPFPVHAADWWKWAGTQTTADSAILDETGANCAVGQARFGLNWYLAGSFSGEPVTRDCAIPVGRTIIFPVISAIAAAFPGDPPEQSTIEYLRSSIADVRDATNLEVEIDGASVPRVARFYEESVPFSLRLPADNIFGVEPTLAKPAVDAGYYIAIPPLAPGLHTLHFHGEVGEFAVDVTYNLTIKRTPFF